ncbi:MAG: hypothetical protein FRX49_02533 [Trebouxia sp. A1-2]|nr:MAG: hypothetical protein FRX49_02533 [Trebouxia sp. A1-2]
MYSKNSADMGDSSSTSALLLSLRETGIADRNTLGSGCRPATASVGAAAKCCLSMLISDLLTREATPSGHVVIFTGSFGWLAEPLPC